MIGTSWEIAGFDRQTAAGLFRAGINPLVSVILASRGITELGDALRAISDDMTLTNPLTFKGMERAAARIRGAIERSEHVAVYGDYDVDGITSSALMSDYLRGKGLRCETYIPNRLEDGYGVNVAGLEKLASLGVTLVITVDCGVTAIAECERAERLGLDMVITDHHECGDELPNVCAIVNPRQPGCASESKNLAGVGVAFKVVCAVEGADKEDELFDRYCDLVILGTIADAVPVTGENRTIIRRGLPTLRECGRLGLRMLCESAGIDAKRLTAGSIGFIIAPRINAAGRIGSADTALRLLISEKPEDARTLANELCALNDKRREIESKMLSDADGMLDPARPPDEPIILYSENWHQGVAGIVASRLADKYNVPVIIICVSGDIGRGSCRSDDNYNIYDALRECKDYFINYGGHGQAAGLTIERDKIEEFKRTLLALPRPEYGGGRRRLHIDFEVVKPTLLSLENVGAMAMLEPYGTANPLPVMCMRDVKITEIIPLSGGRHTKMRVVKNGVEFETIFFGKSPEEIDKFRGINVSIAFTPQINEYMGRRSVQLKLEDIFGG